MLFFNRSQPPHPDHTNVEISGRGWYRYSHEKWHRYEPTGFDPDARWLSDRKLLEFVVDAAVAARGKK